MPNPMACPNQVLNPPDPLYLYLDIYYGIKDSKFLILTHLTSQTRKASIENDNSWLFWLKLLENIIL
jgi:hypothetical protein